MQLSVAVAKCSNTARRQSYFPRPLENNTVEAGQIVV